MANKKDNLHEMAGAVADLAAGNIGTNTGAQNSNKPKSASKSRKSRSAKNSKNVSRETSAKKPTGRPRVYEDVHRFSFNIDGETYKYLKAAAYRESSPEHMVTVTEYVNRLIAADKEKNEGADNE